MLRSLFLLIWVSFISIDILFAQTEREQAAAYSASKNFNLISGYSYSSSHIVELGMSIRKSKTSGYHLFESNLAFSGEVVFGNEFIIGPKISGWIAGGSPPVAMGFSIINYTNFNQNEFSLRPEIGLGIFGLKAVYGYNIKVLGTGFDEISKSSFSFIFPIYSTKR